MNDTSKNGGPAFPSTQALATASGVTTPGHAGMTLRDHFAALAMHAALITPHTWRDLGYTPKSGLDDMQNSACMAYQQADAMLAARGTE